jgi:hypothetical protein
MLHGSAADALADRGDFECRVEGRITGVGMIGSKDVNGARLKADRHEAEGSGTLG